jgi:hypothetical protein
LVEEKGTVKEEGNLLILFSIIKFDWIPKYIFFTNLDGDCPRLQKCCLNGCGWRMCQFPAISSKCLSLQAAAQIFTKFSKHNRAFQVLAKCAICTWHNVLLCIF